MTLVTVALLYLFLQPGLSDLETCIDPNTTDTTCPAGSECWDPDGDSSGERVDVVWSLFKECESCLFAQQRPVVVPRDESVVFLTDGSFQRSRYLEIWNIFFFDLQACAFGEEGHRLVGRLAPWPPGSQPPPPLRGFNYSLDITSFLDVGPNYFIGVEPFSPTESVLPSPCEQGARLTVHVAEFLCGNQSDSVCNNRGPCVYNRTSSSYNCQCPGGYIGPECQKIDECFNNTACGDPAFEGVCVDETCTFACNCAGNRTSSGGKACDKVPVNCDENPCINDGNCMFIPEVGIVCTCLEGFDSERFCADIDDCASNPCENGGVCVDGVSRYTCRCLDGFIGDICEFNINDCVSFLPCLNLGNCTDGENDVSCSCLSPWIGKFCQIHEDDCLTADCMNGGTCVDEDMNHACICVSGYTGLMCESEIDECSSFPCQNGGTCFDQLNDFGCECAPGFAGTLCAIDIDECASFPCQNEAACNDLVNTFRCDCPDGRTGTVCESEIDECASNPCVNDGICIDLTNGYGCECPFGFTGTHCETNINECASNPCENGGTCDDLINRYICDCPDGFTGTHCESNIDECASNPCENGGTCFDQFNDFGCECSPGFDGTLCATDIDECASIPCQNGATCKDLVNTFRCDCPDGWTGTVCESEIDECASNPCVNDGTCIDLTNGYGCECPFGFTGTHCETNINECASNPCENGGTCDDLINRYICDCPDGFTGTHCENNIDECASNPCRNSGLCIDLTNGYICRCFVGFIGIHCETDVDECTSNPCVNHGTCADLLDGYVCKCVHGFAGTHCETDIDECASNPCMNDGTCNDLINGYGCKCPFGFTGTHCETNINECASNPCENGGTCDDLINHYICDCPDGFTGTHCETNIDECASYPCVNNGSCENDINRYNCHCIPGFTGINCETDIDECKSLPCLNGATCNDLIDSFVCECQLGYTGILCETDIDDCSSAPCHFGGRCIDEVNGYSCLCRSGYTGTNCESNIDECSSKPCQNGGTCHDIVNGYLCSCIEGFTGTHCETDIDDCDSNPCVNGGTCIDHTAHYSCQCPIHFTGSHCQTSVDECLCYPCQNDGTCIELFYGFECVCSHQFKGQLCQENVTGCDSNPCQNGGLCMPLGNDYQCTCLPHYTGFNCGRLIRGCELTSCRNGGTCHHIADDIDAFCLCSWGFTGKTCDQGIDITVLAFGHPYESYVQVNGGTRNVTGQGIAIVMKATTPNGLVFLMTSEVNTSNDLVALHLTEGRLDFRINLGSDRVKIVSPEAIPSCVWITVELRYNGELYVDGSLVASSDSPGVPTNIHRYTFLGGIPNHEKFRTATDGHLSGFVGCIRAMSIGGKDLNLVNDVISGQSVGQCPDDPCSHQPCANGGLCQDTGALLTDFNCTCQEPFSGVTCEIFNPCGFDPCLNGGLCQLDKASSVGYRCICTARFIGVECENSSGTSSSHSSLSYSGNSSTVWFINSTDINIEEKMSISLIVKPSVSRVTGFIACLGQANRDILAIVADDGFVKVIMDIGGQRFPLTLQSRQPLNAGQYAYIDVQRTGQDVQLTVSNSTVNGSLDTSFVRFDVGNRLYIGSVPASLLSNSQKSSSGVSSGFSGCISNLTVNRQTFQIADLLFSSNAAECDLGDLCNHLSPCQNGGTCSASGNSLICKCAEKYQGVTCEQFFDPCSTLDCQGGSTCLETRDDAVCLCPLGKSGKLCNEDSLIETPEFSSSLKSFMAYDPLPQTVGHSTLVSVTFKPYKTNGLLIYSDNDLLIDFLALNLNDGFVEFRYNLGSDTAIIRSSNRVTLYQWHSVTAARTDETGSLFVDSESAVSGSSPGISVQLDLTSDLFIGGVNILSQVNNDARVTSGFSGCVSDLTINDNVYNLSFSGQRGHGITDCQDHPCDALNCLNGGTCAMLNSHGRYYCICPDKFTDEFCQREIINPCLDGNGGCHSNSTCVFDSEMQTRTCQCPFTPDPRVGDFCDEIDHFVVPMFKGSSFLQFSYPLVDLRTTLIAFSISAMDTHGLILYMPSKPDFPDFLVVGMMNGKLELRLDLGSGAVRLVSNINITGTSEVWHSVIITRNSRLVALTVDNKTVVDDSPGSLVGLDVDSTFFLGGIPSEIDLSENNKILGGLYTRGFVGCISQLKVYDVAVDVVADALMGLDVENCDYSLV